MKEELGWTNIDKDGIDLMLGPWKSAEMGSSIIAYVDRKLAANVKPVTELEEDEDIESFWVDIDSVMSEID